MEKPCLFIGSSTEGLEFARAVRTLLANDAKVTLWNEGFFELGKTFIESLIEDLARFDFAILVLTADDLTTSRETDFFSPRDNIIFELGLFMGHLGRKRTFILRQENPKLKIPSDLGGIATASYQWTEGDSDQLAAVAVACDSIRRVIHDLKISDTKAIDRLSTRQEKQETKLLKQQDEIKSIQVALQGIVTRFELDKLTGLSKEEAFLCFYSPDLENELKRLRALGLAQNHEGTGLSAMRGEYKDKGVQFDLKRFFFITEQGREYLKLRNRWNDQKQERE